MKIGVLGTGMVGATIATKLVELGHEVMMGSRTVSNEKAARGMEIYLPIWLRIWGALQIPNFNIRIVK